MDLLLKREQSKNIFGRVIFRLWVRSEMGEDEVMIARRSNGLWGLVLLLQFLPDCFWELTLETLNQLFSLSRQA